IGLTTYMRIGKISEQISYDTLGNEIYKSQYLYNDDGRCTTLNIYEHQILSKYFKVTLDVNGYSIKEEVFTPSNSLVEYFINTYSNGNLILRIKYDQNHNEISRFNIEYGKE